MIQIKTFILLTLLSSVAFAAPNDPFFARQWALRNDGSQIIDISLDGQVGLHTLEQKGIAGVDIGWMDAQPEISTAKNSPVIVAVIDTGLDITHPDLQDRIWTNPALGSGTDLHGWNFLKSTENVADDVGHGTHVSGTIIAGTDNGVGLAGVAGNSNLPIKLMPLRVYSKDFTSFVYYDSNGRARVIADYVGDAIYYAIAHHANIINLSLGWPKIVDNHYARTAVADAIKAGILVVAAAGNNHKDQPTYPCSYEGVLCVGAITNTGAMTAYSDFGGHVDILAPGDDIISTFPMNLDSPNLRLQGYELDSGTSMASPHIAGMAAVLKSLHPEYSVDELKAHLLASTRAIPSEGASLYGLANLNLSLKASPKPIYFPNFKSLTEVSVDEHTLMTSGNLQVKNLWTDAKAVSAVITINGKTAGSTSLPLLSSGQSFTIPWKFQFSSLDDSSSLRLDLAITDSTGELHHFFNAVSATRLATAIENQKMISISKTDTGTPFIANATAGLNLSRVTQFARFQGAPIYFAQLPTPNTTLEIIQPILDSNLNPETDTVPPIKTVTVPFVSTILNVIQLDVLQNGKLDWVIIGTKVIQNANKQNETVLQFYFLDPAFQPLFGANSAWQIDLDTKVNHGIIHAYSGIGSWVQLPHLPSTPGFNGMDSWIQSKGRLLPSFIAKSTLPPIDNFDSLDIRHFQSDQHLFYLEPDPTLPADPSGAVTLRIRALDNATLRRPYAELHVQSLAPSSDAEEQVGHQRVFCLLGHDLDALAKIWDIPSVEQAQMQSTQGWDLLSVSGTQFRVNGGNLGSAFNAYLNSFDQYRQALTWADSSGKYLGRTEFSFNQTMDAIASFTGAFELPNQGRFWFVQSNFDLVGYHQLNSDSPIEMKTLPIERDSSFGNQQLSTMMSPVTVGTSQSPQPGIYMDSTTIRGDQIAVAIFDAEKATFDKPLRYSLQIPEGCSQVNPVQISQTVESFAVPLVCKNKDTAEFRFVFPR